MTTLQLTTPQRIQLRGSRGWRKPDDVVSVARPGEWGNPWRIVRHDGCWYVTLGPGLGDLATPASSPAAARALAVDRFRTALLDGTLPPVRERAAPITATVVRQHLRGRSLACWCPPGVPCHADVLIELANSPDDA